MAPGVLAFTYLQSQFSGRRRQEDSKLQPSLGNLARIFVKIKNKKRAEDVVKCEDLRFNPQHRKKKLISPDTELSVYGAKRYSTNKHT